MTWTNGAGWNAHEGGNVPAAAGGGDGSFATWDPTDFEVADTFGNARIQLTGPANLIATSFNSSGGFCFTSGNRAFSGQSRFEVTISGVNPGITLAAPKTNGAGGGLFGGNGGLIWATTGHVFIGFADQGAIAPTYANGDVCGIEVDMTAKKAYFVVNSGSRLPSTGLDISGMTGPLYPAADCGNSNGNIATARFGPPWTTTTTAGYGAIP